MLRHSGVPYWRLSGGYFAYFAVIGALVPYLNPYFKLLGCTPAQIGLLTGALVAGRIVSPTLWGWIADHHGGRMRVVRVSFLLSLVSFLPMLWITTYAPALVVMLVFGFLWSASLPQFEAVTFNHLGDSTEAYTRIRVWGSISFIVTVVALGWIFERTGLTPLPAVLVGLLAAATVMSLYTPDRRVPHPRPARMHLARVLGQPKVAALLAVCLLTQVSYGPYYNFYTIYLEEHGYARGVVGQLWALGVAAEVLLFLVMHRLLPWMPLRLLMLLSIAATTVRWLLIAGFVQWLFVLVLAQLLHAISFGMQHVAAVQFIHRYFTGRHQGRGQALYSSVAYGVGGAAGALSSGYLWEGRGPVWTFTAASLLCVLAFAIAWRWLEGAPQLRPDPV
ncbi:MAG TPA: MFS transporter [Gammaproteobacteria bacterium]|nr:MFS transporter [Gammaproteobacteria bacterium]